MVGKYKTLLSASFLLTLIHLVESQLTRMEELARNNCGDFQGLPENLSCAPDRFPDPCLPSSALCNGVSDCDDGEDEGAAGALNALECGAVGKGQYCV